MRSGSPCSSLLRRINNQRRRDAINIRIEYIQIACSSVVFYIAILLIFQCYNRVYNSWKGPFPMNLNQFRNHLITNYNSFGYNSLFSFRWLYFQPDYLQIELDENVIDETVINTPRMFYGHYSHGVLLYLFNQVLSPTIDGSQMALYIKFASYEQSYSQIRYPYNFQSFNMNTLRCIARQLNIPSREFSRWSEESKHIQNIEEIYNKNPKVFNKKVIKKCGIIIGYLYKPTGEYIFPGYSYEPHRFHDDVRVFDASCNYTPYASYFVIFFFIYFMFKYLPNLIRAIIKYLRTLSPMLHPFIQEQIQKLNITSVADLDSLLLDTFHENNFNDSLFIVRDKYLVMLMLDLDEDSPEILREFYEKPPFAIISINSISKIESDHIVVEKHYCSQCIYFPKTMNTWHFNPAYWLHEKLMILNDEYRYNWRRCELLRRQEEARRAQEEERKLRFRHLIEEEAEYQQHHYGNNVARILQGRTQASPRFIAEFRLADPQTVNDNMSNETCNVCFDDFKLNQRVGQWPCDAKHSFHFNCMLNVLRAGYKCPVCRHPVEAVPLPSGANVLQFIVENMISNSFT
ncbi:unnamed protein product [Rotaria magnacalcarata]|uniref:RING-type domain-containing protein n=1 Tax=Rotaria magnacalcarata TaxID=392030 RepID=A0A820C1J6_9BILA|nr:unnamed protein product [Rotaria magnacalcarata]CAF4214868.1 unnamed protein product [Rotaria magnacalcarata]